MLSLLRLLKVATPILFLLIPIQQKKFMWLTGEALLFNMQQGDGWVFIYSLLLLTAVFYSAVSGILDLKTGNDALLCCTAMMLILGQASLNLLGSLRYGDAWIYLCYGAFYVIGFIYLYLAFTLPLYQPEPDSEFL